ECARISPRPAVSGRLWQDAHRASPHPLQPQAGHDPSAAIYCTSPRRISARNQIKGTVIEVTKGATTSHVRVDIGNGTIVTSSITNEAVDDLGIKVKGNVTVVIKASDVMIAGD